MTVARFLVLFVLALPVAAMGQGGNGPAPLIGFRFGQCLANYKPQAADALLATKPGSADEATAYRELIPFQENRCVQVGARTPGGIQLHVPIPLLRGYLAQTRYLRLYPDAAPTTVGAVRPTEISQQILLERLAAAEDRSAEMVRIFGDCVVAAKPIEADALIRTDVRSDEEGEALGHLSDALGPCAWEGQTLQFTQETLRFALAEALFRKAQNQTDPAMAASQGSN